MKTSINIIIFGLITLYCIGQEPPVNDTLIPKQHKRDTIKYEPKLQGGALIDTINTKDNKLKHQPARIDTAQKKPTQKKDSVEKKLGIKPEMIPVQPDK